MGVPRLKTNRKTERRKVSLAVKYKGQGKATGGGRITAKKTRRKLEARNIRIRKTAPKKVKARTGRRRST